MPQDHEPPMPLGFLQVVNPTETLGGPLPGDLPEDQSSEAPDEGPALSTKADTVSQFTFQYKIESKSYKATITHSALSGYDIAVEKWTGNGWGPTATTLKKSLLAAFIVQQAVLQAQAAAQVKKPKFKKPSSDGDPYYGPKHTPDEEVPIADTSKKPVKG